ncbi:MAG: hypothetical protein L3J74_02650 [Bacteroidales bacterium]|nr:hypothetical protein [Bacteroidales bacterium]
MGLSIHYSGEFNKKSSLKNMINELKDIAENLNWEYFIYEDDFPENSLNKKEFNKEKLYGISLLPPNCEPVNICFLSNGRMSAALNLQLWANPKNKEEKQYLYMIATKTQFAGIEIHKTIIHLFRYLDTKYLTNFKLTDESNYWETMDENELKKGFDKYNKILDMTELALRTTPKKQNESYQEYFNKLVKMINKFNKKP